MNGKLILCLVWLPISVFAKGGTSKAAASVKFSFDHNINGVPLVFNEGIYKNSNGDSFTVSMFKYYVSNISFINVKGESAEEINSYHLVNAAKPATESFTINLPEGAYNKVRFMLGVDSLHNVSGAQGGDLDPINAMFWDWNTGYIMLKMEGNYVRKTAAEIAYHLGGYKSKDKALRWVELELPETITVNKNSSTKVQIGVNIAAMFGNPHIVDFSKEPVVTSQSRESAEIADNCVRLFTIKKIGE